MKALKPKEHWPALLFLVIYLGVFLQTPYLSPITLEIEGEIPSDLTLLLRFNHESHPDLAIPVPLAAGRQPLEDKVHVVEIRRVGEANPNASGKEVWLQSIRTPEENLDLANQLDSGQAELIHERLALTADGATLRFKQRFTHLELDFVKHPHSGIAEISLDGRPYRTVDLYSHTERTESITVDAVLTPQKVVHAIDLPLREIRSIQLEGTRDLDFLSAIRVAGKPLLHHSSKALNSRKHSFDDLDIEQRQPNLLLRSLQVLGACLATWVTYLGMRYASRFRRPTLKGSLKAFFIDEKRWVFWCFWLVSGFTFATWFIGQWPGAMTGDSFDIWKQTQTLQFKDWHPFAYTLGVFFLTQLFKTPAIVGLIQTAFISGLGSYIFYFTIKRGAPLFLVLPLFVAFASSIAIGTLNLLVWKDVAFSYLVIFWAFVLYYLGIRRSARPLPLTTNQTLVMATLFVLLCTVRHNGIVYAAFIPAAMVVYRLLPWRSLLKFTATSLIMFIVLQYGVGNWIGAYERTNKHAQSVNWKINPLAAMFASKWYASDNYEEDQRIMEILLPISEVREKYLPQHSDPLFFHPNINKKLTKEDVTAIDKLFYKSVALNLPIFLADRTHMFASALIQQTGLYWNDLNPRSITDYNVASANGIVFQPLSETLHQWQNHVIDLSRDYKARFLFWNALFPLALLSLLALGYKWLPLTALFAATILYQVPFLFLTLPANDFRYVYFIYLAGFFALPLAWAERTKAKLAHR